MPNFDDLHLFSKIAELNSYTKAAKQLNISKATISRRIKHLEERLGVMLINRDTRKLSLTEAGKHLFESTISPLRALSEAERETSNYQTKPAGNLKITIPVEVSIRLLNDIISDFAILHPQINLEVNITNEIIDIINDGYDIAIRGGAPQDSNLVYKKILSSRLNFCCSKAYLKENTPLPQPFDIKSLEFMTYTSSGHQHIKLTKNSEEAVIQINNRMQANSFEMLLNCAVKGYGIAILPTSVCYDALKSGELVRIFQDWETPYIALYALYPDRKKTKKLELFIEYLEHRLKAIEVKFDGLYKK